MKSWILSLSIIVLILGVLSTPAHAVSTTLVISQIYTGTGTGLSTVVSVGTSGITEMKPQYQFIELFNKGTSAVSLTGWTLQYAMEGVNTWQTFPLTGSIAAG